MRMNEREERRDEKKIEKKRENFFYLPTTFGDNHFIHNRIEFSPKIFILKTQIDTIILGVWRRHIALDDWEMIETTFYDS